MKYQRDTNDMTYLKPNMTRTKYILYIIILILHTCIKGCTTSVYLYITEQIKLYVAWLLYLAAHPVFLIF